METWYRKIPVGTIVCLERMADDDIIDDRTVLLLTHEVPRPGALIELLTCYVTLGKAVKSRSTDLNHGTFYRECDTGTFRVRILEYKDTNRHDCEVLT